MLKIPNIYNIINRKKRIAQQEHIKREYIKAFSKDQYGNTIIDVDEYDVAWVIVYNIEGLAVKSTLDFTRKRSTVNKDKKLWKNHITYKRTSSGYYHDDDYRGDENILTYNYNNTNYDNQSYVNQTDESTNSCTILDYNSSLNLYDNSDYSSMNSYDNQYYSATEQSIRDDFYSY